MSYFWQNGSKDTNKLATNLPIMNKQETTNKYLKLTASLYTSTRDVSSLSINIISTDGIYKIKHVSNNRLSNRQTTR